MTDTIKKLQSLSMQEAQDIGGKTFAERCDVVLGPKVRHTPTGIQIMYASKRTKEFLSSKK